jgi:hypothetical protein
MDCGIVRNKISQVKYNGNQIGTIDMASLTVILQEKNKREKKHVIMPLMIILPKGTNKNRDIFLISTEAKQ